MNRPRFVGAVAAGLVVLIAAARGQDTFNGPNQIRSVSGQFTVSFAPNQSFFYRRPEVGTNAEMLRLEPSLLAIAADHFKAALWQMLAVSPEAAWRGKIFLVLHPARFTNETVVIATEPFLESWNYRLQLPDLLTPNRYARALSAGLLMEIANRQVPVAANPAVGPPWLADGLARLVLESDPTQAILSAPQKVVNTVPLRRISENRRGLDPQAAARRVLQNHQALTFDELSWPTEAQVEGWDEGVYLASVELFVHELLELKNGPARLRDFVTQLPACRNWQTAFFAAFRDDFPRPLDVEKWWALRVVAFAAHDPGPLWTTDLSRRKLAAALTVPVDIRQASNALPSHASLSLQAAVRSLAPSRQTEILETKVRDLALIQFRLAGPLAALGGDYRRALREFLDEQKKSTAARFRRSDTAKLIAQLDALDQRRQQLEAALDRRSLQLPTP